MTNAPQPTQQDIANAETRAAIAQRQNEVWGRVYTWALGAFRPGWEPVGRHYLVGKVVEGAARRNPLPGAIIPRARFPIFRISNKSLGANNSVGEAQGATNGRGEAEGLPRGGVLWKVEREEYPTWRTSTRLSTSGRTPG
jgi:hypothetical protein